MKKFNEFKNLREGFEGSPHQSMYARGENLNQGRSLDPDLALQKRVKAAAEIIEQNQDALNQIDGGKLYNLLRNTLSGIRDNFL